MTKANITRLFVAAVVAGIAGIVLVFAAIWAAFAGGVFEMDGPDVIGINQSPFAALMILFALLGMLAFIGAGIAGLISWIGALLNTAQFEDKTWFLLLLLLGIFSLGFFAMIAYVIGGPDATAPEARRAQTIPRPS